ncbi:MAG: hypothetical protein PHC64_10880 [Candidatus Gastranaerophilales bacterium]|nr:hypothetical protein [Candidatus Gastranaerophilales bacterium]
MSGWVKLYRKLTENPLWTCEPFTRGQAWVDLILLTNYKDSFFYKRGVKINVKAGQCAWSELALSARWGWSRSKIRKFLNDLEKEHQIIQQKNNVTQIVTIVNYNEYQEKKTANDTPKEQQKDTSKEVKEVKEDIKLHSENFLNFQQVVSFFDSKFFNQDKWLDCYDKLIRIDKYSENEILGIVKEFRADGNWWKDSGNFESLTKLRKKNKDGIKYIDLFKTKLKKIENYEFAESDFS